MSNNKTDWFVISNLIVYILSLVVMTISIVGIAFDNNHSQAYCYTFVSFALIGVFSLTQYENHKRV